MSDLWWELPGPARFVSGLVRSLRAGQNVVLCMPLHSPKPLAALRAALEREESWKWTTVRLGEEDERAAPLDFLFTRFAPEVAAGEIRSAATLATEDSFCGRLVCVDELPNDLWPAWKSFLVEYEHVCRSIPLLQRTLFCLCLEGEVAIDPPVCDVCLAVHRYDDFAQQFDSLLYASLLIEGAKLVPLQKRLAASVIAALSLWDPFVAERLAEEDLAQLLQPASVLDAFARERGWMSVNCPNEESLWCQGMKNMFDGAPKIHSAVLAALGKRQEVERRIWSAQVGVLFPFIEEKRQELVDELRSILRVPFTKKTGEVVTDLRDLEIGHIESQVRNLGRAVGDDKLRLIEKLRRVRNHLSHLELVPPELVAARELCG